MQIRFTVKVSKIPQYLQYLQHKLSIILESFNIIHWKNIKKTHIPTFNWVLLIKSSIGKIRFPIVSICLTVSSLVSRPKGVLYSKNCNNKLLYYFFPRLPFQNAFFSKLWTDISMLKDMKSLVEKPVLSLHHMHNNERSMRREAEETLPFRDYHLVILLWSWLRDLRDSL